VEGWTQKTQEILQQPDELEGRILRPQIHRPLRPNIVYELNPQGLCIGRPRSRSSSSPLYRYGENSGDSMHAEPHLRTSCHYQSLPLNPFLSNDRVKRKDFPEVARLPWA